MTSAPGWRAAGLPDLPWVSTSRYYITLGISVTHIECHERYPGLVADATANAPGRLYLDLTEREWKLLDAFENPLYDVAVVTLANDMQGLAYVWPTVGAPMALITTWTLKTMDEKSTEEYLSRVVGWREEWEESWEES